MSKSGPSTVRDIVHRKSQKKWALKQFGLRGLKAKQLTEALEIIRSQIGILTQTRKHPNIARLHETFVDKNYYFLVMEHCEGGDILDRIQEEGRTTERDAASVVQQVLKAVGYLHDNLIVHRDIKPDNVMLKTKGPLFGCTAKVIDFNCACRISQSGQILKEQVGTPYYASPQVFRGAYTEQCDVWSCGVLLYVMLLGFPRSKRDQNADVASLVKAGKFIADEQALANTSIGVQELLGFLLAKDEASRINPTDASQHLWIVRQAAQPEGSRVQVAPDAVGVLRMRSFSPTKSNRSQPAFFAEELE